jgi:hypothetical protein
VKNQPASAAMSRPSEVLTAEVDMGPQENETDKESLKSAAKGEEGKSV